MPISRQPARRSAITASRLRVEPFSPQDLSYDAFLGGRLIIAQPRTGYRAGIDPVLLAASVVTRPGDSLLDLGCGSGIAGLCVAVRVPGIRLTGLEVQPAYTDLARQNAARNGIASEFITGDLVEMPADLRQRHFDHVIANPPYFDRHASTAAQDPGRERAMAEDAPLADWVRAAARRVAPKGTVTFIQRAERLPDLLAAMKAHLGSLHLRPLIPRRGRAARLVLIRGTKGGRAALRLHDGWLLHDGTEHARDGESFTAETQAVLRDAAALPWPR